MTGTTHGAALISLPRSQVEMSDFDVVWQDRITKVVGRVAKNLLANDESEVSEVVRRRLFGDLGQDRFQKKVAKAYADWCFERRAQLPPEWTLVDSAATETKAREHLQQRFEACYPFHPAALSVFQRKWQALPQFQQTRGTLAMLAQWISWAQQESFKKARTEPLISLGSAPLEVPDFASVVLGQLGESRLSTAIDADIAGAQAHARALDADSKGALRDIHRRVGTTMLFESSGGQVDRVAHLPELRFALGEPAIDTTSIDAAAMALEERSYFLRRVGTDGFRISYRPTIKKVVNDRRASLDEQEEIRPAIRKLVKEDFDRGGPPSRASASPARRRGDSGPRRNSRLVVMDPEAEWTGSAGDVRERIAQWTRAPRGVAKAVTRARSSGRCGSRDANCGTRWNSGSAWKRVASEVSTGALGNELDRAEVADIRTKVTEVGDAAREEVWGRIPLHGDRRRLDSRTGWMSWISGRATRAAATASAGRVISALKSSGLLNESVGAGYLERNWPPALKDDGAWPLASLRQSFLNGSLTRLVEPDTVLRRKIVEFVGKGDFGLGSGRRADREFDRVWFQETLDPEDVTFESDVHLLTSTAAEGLRASTGSAPPGSDAPEGASDSPNGGGTVPGPEPVAPLRPEPAPSPAPAGRDSVRIHGQIPPEIWNRIGTRLLPKLRSSHDLKVGVTFELSADKQRTAALLAEVEQASERLAARIPYPRGGRIELGPAWEQREPLVIAADVLAGCCRKHGRPTTDA